MDPGQTPHSRDGEVETTGDREVQIRLLPNGSKPAKPRHMSAKKNSLNEVKKRVAGIGEYVSRTQPEMVREKIPAESSTSPGHGRPSQGQRIPMNGSSKLSKEIRRDDSSDHDKALENSEEVRSLGVDVEHFKKMSSLEMGSVLIREIRRWQQDYGKYGEK